MKISTRGRYAVRVMLDLAEQDSEAYIPLADIAGRQEISEKYLESIVSVLSKNQLVRALRGKGGGYRLAKKPSEYTIGSILRAAEGSLAPAACLEEGTPPCSRLPFCKTRKMWEGLYRCINEYFDGVTLQDLLEDNETFFRRQR